VDVSELSDRFSFDQWVGFVFDHEITRPEWYWAVRDDYEWLENSPVTVAEYWSRLFEEPGLLLERFSREQVGEGLWYLSSDACSEYWRVITLDAVPSGIQERSVRSIGRLFERLFAPQCGAELGHLNYRKSGSDALNMACYMWWHHFPCGEVTSDRLRGCIEVMEGILKLKSEACCESALHGLGHLRRRNSVDVSGIVDRFLTESPRISRELKDYAERARDGDVQ
jgi:hypothetical protein